MDPTAICPFTVERPVMRQRWYRLSFLHWRFEPALVQRLLPAWLTVDTFDGSAWVGLVPFEMRVATARRDAALPWVSNFCETNVRTYVRDGEDRPGVWFFSLDAARLGAVLAARSTYRLPYFWSSMSVTGPADEPRYTLQRRWPGPYHGVTSHLRIGVGAQYDPHDLGPLDHFLTARWRLFSPSGHSAAVSHGPWPLARAKAAVADDQLLEAAGLPSASDEPLVHYSPGVDVLVGGPVQDRP